MSSTPPKQPHSRQRTLQIVAYWFQLVLQPILAVVFVVGLTWFFGYLQRNQNWFQDGTTSTESGDNDRDAQYACSMLCVFVSAPGRCPVCGMELQKIETTGDPKDIYGLTIDPTARRLANIKTVAALTEPIANQIEALGKIAYDETRESSVASYVEGRIEKLVVDYTGATIQQGDELAILYSPSLYSDQVGLLQAKSELESASQNERVQQANLRLYESTRRRLLEQGIPPAQVDAIERAGKAESRLKIFAPSSGTVIEKLVEVGDYVQVGTPLFKMADLSTVWLMLELYPEDASHLRIGQTVIVELQSQVGQPFEGHISFVDPAVDPASRVVKVRVAIGNEAGLIKIGDLGKAKIQTTAYDSASLVFVPRDAVLMNGPDSIAYVETEPGRFEFRRVEVAEILGDRVSLSEGIQPGEQVVASGTFMLDSTFNIQGKASLIDPNRAIPADPVLLADDSAEALEIEESFAPLSPSDRELAEAQIICPVTEVKLGTMGMGTPIRVDVGDKPIMICCEGCRFALLEDPEKHLQVLEQYHTSQRNEPPAVPALESNGDLPEMELPEMELPEMELPS